MVNPDYPPTLLLHGEKDNDVPFEQSVLMAKSLEKNNVVYEFIRNADWGHVFDGKGLKDPLVKEAFEQILVFLADHVK